MSYDKIRPAKILATLQGGASKIFFPLKERCISRVKQGLRRFPGSRPLKNYW